MNTDPIADMLTRIRNGIMAQKREVEMPRNKVKVHIAQILKSEGYIAGYEVREDSIQGTLVVNLRYIGEDMETPIHGMKRVSSPGRRVYASTDEIPKVLGGLGVAIVSTSKGLMTGKAARKANVGGEVLCSVW